MASLSSNVTHMPLSYHEVTALRLPLVTAAGLQAAGIPLEALGTREGKTQVLSSCFTLSPFAREILPPSLGGTAGENAVRLSPASAEFVRKVRLTSPIKPPPPELSGSVRVSDASSILATGGESGGGGGGGGGSSSCSMSARGGAAEFTSSRPFNHTRLATKLAFESTTVSSETSDRLLETVAEDSSARFDAALGEHAAEEDLLPSQMGELRLSPRHTFLDHHDISSSSTTSVAHAPKDLQTHIKAARSNDQARARAFAVLSIAEVRFPLVGEALRDACLITSPAVMADFPAVALEEAATAFGFQLSGLHILLASAKVHTGARHALVTSYLSDRFDEQASDLIHDWKVKLNLNPLELAMGCYPILQLALALFYAHHAPITPSASPIVDIAKNVKLTKGTVFNPARGLDAFFGAHASARADKFEYDYGACSIPCTWHNRVKRWNRVSLPAGHL